MIAGLIGFGIAVLTFVGTAGISDYCELRDEVARLKWEMEKLHEEIAYLTKKFEEKKQQPKEQTDDR